MGAELVLSFRSRSVPKAFAKLIDYESQWEELDSEPKPVRHRSHGSPENKSHDRSAPATQAVEMDFSSEAIRAEL